MRLNLRREHVFKVFGLASDKETLGDNAITFFVSCARRADYAFSPTQAELEEIATLCHFLDGNPLAIAMAAALVEMMPIRAILGAIGDGADFTPVREVEDAERPGYIRIFVELAARS